MSSSNRVSELSPERALPEQMAGRLMESEHRGRYLWSAQLARGLDVLDAGCGTGYGTHLLAASRARRAVGIDISEEAIEQARAGTSAAETCEFVLGDLHALPFEQGEFDLVVCFEAIEHVTDQAHVIGELRRVLRPEGVLVLSSPNRDVYPPGNPYHTHEFIPHELEQALLGHFVGVQLYRQSPWLGAAILDDEQSRACGSGAALPLPTVKIASIAPGEEMFTIALASDGPLPQPEALALLGEPFEVRWWEARIAEVEGEREQERTRRAEHGRALLELEAEFAQALEQVARLEAAEDDVRRWAVEQASERDELLRRHEQDRLDLERRLARAEQTIAGLTGSLSWRMTSPIRALKRIGRGA
jgi:SAM-dependent methyltransferase